MRLGEAVGLLKEDIILEDEVPHVRLVPHSWRRLKTKGSQRNIPLVGASLWACKRLLEANDDSIFAFPRYCNGQTANANSASGALNKWLSEYVPEGCVIHSFRHSMRDRLRAVQCPSDMIDQIGGWTTASVGQGYGEGYDLEVINSYFISTTLALNKP
jgi:integrase